MIAAYGSKFQWVTSNLYLLTHPRGTQSWVFRFQLFGRRRDMGLGPYPKVSRDEAERKTAEAMSMVEAGRDPIAAREHHAVYIARIHCGSSRPVYKIGLTDRRMDARRVEGLARRAKARMTVVLLRPVIDARHVERELLNLGQAVDLDGYPPTECRRLTAADLAKARDIAGRFTVDGKPASANSNEETTLCRATSPTKKSRTTDPTS